MIVVPKCAQRFVDIAIRLVCRCEASQDIRIVLVVEMPDLKKVQRVAVAFRGRVAIVEMRGNRWHSETAILAQGRKSIMIASELTDTILSGIRWTGTHDSVSVVEAPNSLWGQARANLWLNAFCVKLYRSGGGNG